jgi:hypothetical protein
VLSERSGLPSNYNVPLLELLVVDPYFIFVSWEITAQQLEQARAQFGKLFEQRRLRIAIVDAISGEQLTIRELYGEVGRWFIHLDQPGCWIRAELSFQLGNEALILNRAGNVFVPRDVPVEPEQWDELFVQYSISERGELRIESLQQQQSDEPPLRPVEAQQLLADESASLSFYSRHLAARLLRPLLPKSPAATEEGSDD